MGVGGVMITRLGSGEIKDHCVGGDKERQESQFFPPCWALPLPFSGAAKVKVT